MCGEYISLESWEFVKGLGIPLESLNLPIIKRLQVSSPSGNSLYTNLDLGGFGISRYKLDELLFQNAKMLSVEILERTKVSDITYDGACFSTSTDKATYKSKITVGAFGKRSNLDIKWNRQFTKKKNSKLNNYIGIKYHITGKFDNDLIALHNFKNGYCGVSKIEDDKYCMCYLTTAQNLAESNNSIEKMEQQILSANPHLKSLFLNTTRVFSSPVTISQISFDKKELVYNNVICIGDAAGMITPLCGNGMSMAFKSSQILNTLVTRFLESKITFAQLKSLYINNWEKEFKTRLNLGRQVQSLFGNKIITNLFIGFLKLLPDTTKLLIKKTHGQPF